MRIKEILLILLIISLTLLGCEKRDTENKQVDVTPAEISQEPESKPSEDVMKEEPEPPAPESEPEEPEQPSSGEDIPSVDTTSVGEVDNIEEPDFEEVDVDLGDVI